MQIPPMLAATATVKNTTQATLAVEGAPNNTLNSQSLGVTTPQALAQQLNIKQPQLFIATIVAQGTLNAAQLPAILAKLLATERPTLKETSNPPTPHNTAPTNALLGQPHIKWLKIAVTPQQGLLLLLPAHSPSAQNITVSATYQTQQMATNTSINIVLSPNGKITLPNTQAPSLTLVSSSTAETATKPPEALPQQTMVAPTKPLNNLAPQTAKTLNLPGVFQLAQALKQTLQQHPITLTLQTSLATIQTQISALPPSVKQQLLPLKILEALSPISASEEPKKLENSLTTLINPNAPQATIKTYQTALNLVSRIAGSNLPTDLGNLLQALSSTTTHHEQVQQSRIAIARWLAGELTGHIARLGITQTANAAQLLEMPHYSQIEQEIPLRWGENHANLHLKIQEEPQKDQKTPKKANRHQESCWRIYMTLELPGYQKLGVEASLMQTKLSLSFWSSSNALYQAINNNIKHLTHSLNTAGIALDTVKSHQGIAPTKPQSVLQTRVDIIT